MKKSIQYIFTVGTAEGVFYTNGHQDTRAQATALRWTQRFWKNYIKSLPVGSMAHAICIDSPQLKIYRWPDPDDIGVYPCESLTIIHNQKLPDELA